jgi:putative tryptophan/tyrosine transport system substrate-binding protein
MKRREFILLIGSGAAAALPPLRASAQQKAAAIGFLGAGGADTSAQLVDAFKQGLGENGLVEGKDYVLEPHWAEGEYERFPAFARELVERNARVIVVTTIAAARAAQRATSVIPIVMASINDPVGSGIVASLARPGGNTTGMATLNQDVTPKLVEFAHTLLPKATTIAAFFNPANPSNLAMLDNLRSQTGPIGVSVRAIEVNTLARLNDALAAVVAQQSDALLVVPDAATLNLIQRIAGFGLQHRIPVISTNSDLTSAGGLISYGSSRRETYRRSAYFVKKVLDGVKPADLPVEQPTRVILSINLKTAGILGLAIPDALLATADEVIE